MRFNLLPHQGKTSDQKGTLSNIQLIKLKLERRKRSKKNVKFITCKFINDDHGQVMDKLLL